MGLLPIFEQYETVKEQCNNERDKYIVKDP